MKLRKLALVLAFSILLALLPAQAAAGADGLSADGALYAGYSKLRIDPSEHPDGPITGLPMPGYGPSTDRLSEGCMDDTGDGIVDERDGLFVTCIAITDQYGKTVIYYGIDVLNPTSSWINPAKTQILAQLRQAGYRLEAGDLYLSASHTHNGPDLTYGVSFSQEKLDADPIAQVTEKYRIWVYERLAQAALLAMEGREEVTLTKGEMDVSDTILEMNPNATPQQQRMNAVRHYKTVVNGETKYGGSNFGYTKYTKDTTFAMDPVDRMHLIRLTPISGNDPIVMVNWDAHVTFNSTTSTAHGKANHRKMSSDWVNSLRYGLEAEGYRVAFSQSTGGNKTGTPSPTVLKNPDVMVDGVVRDYKYGGRLAEIVLYGLENLMSDPLDTSRIRNMTASFSYQTNAPTPEEAALITAMLAADPSTYPAGYESLVDYLCHADTWPLRTQYYETYPYLKNINSRYQLQVATSRMKYLTTEQSSMTVGVLSIGRELSFVVAPNELADRYSATDTLDDVRDNDWDDLIDQTYGRPIVMGYTNGANGYIPHQLAYTYNEGSADYAVGSYESQVSVFGRYTGERLVAFYDDMLDEVNTDEGRYQCTCGGKAESGKNGHVCQTVEFLPWAREDTLPTGGNYYLTCDVITTTQTALTGTTLRLDLNGHSITYRVSAAEGANAEAGTAHLTRVLTVATDAQLFITDSTGAPGTIRRDLSQLTEIQREKITNYGLLVFIQKNGACTLFDGILDAAGQRAGGGGCVCVYNEASDFIMYGGLLKGGKSYNGGVVFNRGETRLYGGELTGGTTTGTTGYPGVYCLAETGYSMGRLLLGGDVRIRDNKRTNGKQINVYSSRPEEAFTVAADFTGLVGIAVSDRSDGVVIGRAERQTLLPGSLLLDNSDVYRIAIRNGKLVLENKPSGDLDGNGAVDVDDVVRLLLHVTMPDIFELQGQGDIDGGNGVNVDDVVKLLLHVTMPEVFPL